MSVDDERIDAKLMQARGDRKPGLSAANDNDRRIVIGISARLGEAVTPVFGAEITRAVASRMFLECFFVAFELLQRRDDRPGAQPRRRLRIVNEAHDTAAAADGCFEF